MLKKENQANEVTGNMTDFPLYLFHHERMSVSMNCSARTKRCRPDRKGTCSVYGLRTRAGVSVVGDFNDWKAERNVMNRMVDGESFELFIPGLKQYDTYKYCITAADGRQLLKADPVGFHTETPPATASKLYELEGYDWQGQGLFRYDRKSATSSRRP